MKNKIWNYQAFANKFKHTSITSVRPYLIHEDRWAPEICTTTVGLGGRPWPSHNRLSHEMTDSHIGASVMSNTNQIPTKRYQTQCLRKKEQQQQQKLANQATKAFKSKIESTRKQLNKIKCYPLNLFKSHRFQCISSISYKFTLC